MTHARKTAWLTGAGSLLAGLVYIWAQFIEPFWLELTTPAITCPRLPEPLDGLRVLFLSDMHIQTWTRRENDLMELLRRLPEKPELIVWGGDFLFHFGETEQGLRVAKAVCAIFGGVPTYGVLGNAEHKISPAKTAAFVRDLEAVGVRILNNRAETLTVRGTAINLVGVDDPYYGHDDLALAMTEVDTSRFTILLSHSPQIVYQATRLRVDLMLSGHTHGGQIRLPLVGALKAQNPLGTRLDRGLFDRARLKPILSGREVPESFRLYITRGIGVAPTWRLFWLRPRLLCRPEIALITLRRAPVPAGEECKRHHFS